MQLSYRKFNSCCESLKDRFIQLLDID